VQYEQWAIMFQTKNAIIESHLLTAVGENQPIANVLQTVTPQYLPNLKKAFIPTMLKESIVYFTYLDDINSLIKKMSADECRQFKVTNINGIGPFWSGLVFKKNSTWFKKLNYIVTERMTCCKENKCRYHMCQTHDRDQCPIKF
jgi:hypothetical protein